MEMVMSAILSAPVAVQGIAGQSWSRGLTAALQRWWLAYITWRIEQAAIRELWSLSDRGLKDIGLSRSGIAGAVREAARERASSLYC
jgi:uncharacterized protein YjiS (DUF1127 family)